jgi:threonine aldolase
MREIYQLAKSKGLRVHLDGARLWNASIASGIEPHEYARWSDSVSVCLSKGLGAPIGSLVSGPNAFIDRVHRFRKMFGGGMRQVGILAAAGIYALDHHLKRLTEDHQNAKSLALGLKEIEGISIDPELVETNIVIFDVSQTGKNAPQIVEAMKKEKILTHAFGKTHIRLVTHLDVNREEIEIALSAFQKVIG